MSAAKDEVQDFSLNYENMTVADAVFSESTDRENNYVVLFAGGYSAEANRPYYYENIKGMYKLLLTQYSIEPNNIYVIYADGVNDGADNSLGVNSDMSFASSSTVLAATEENLKNVFAEISVKADSNDHFLFYSFDHGAETADGTDYLCGWDCIIKDTDFAAYASTITAGYQTYLMSQCYTWGMLEDITVTDNMFLGGSSANDRESQMAGADFSIFGTSAVLSENVCTVEFPMDNFDKSVMVRSGGSGMDLFNDSDSDYQMRICYSNGSFEEPVISTVKSSESEEFVSEANENLDIVQKSSVSGEGYAAMHQGIAGGLAGTREVAYISDKNLFTDTFTGSEDANVLLSTDDANGDALFVDDLFSADIQNASLSEIKEISAGAGDDIIDLTSERLEYDGVGVAVYSGGGGNDVIWANDGENTLFGGSGDDRMVGGSDDDVIIGGIGNDSVHGGGGNDIFVFGRDWGSDTVTQLADGSVTLWFATGVNGSWDVENMTFTANGNTVKVEGVSADKVTLKFGNDGSEMYTYLNSKYAFSTDSPDAIFSEKLTGTIYTNEIIADTVISNNIVDIRDGETATNVMISSGGRMNIYSGGIANSTTVSSGCVFIESGVANDTVVTFSGGVSVFSGGTANGTVVDYLGSMYVYGDKDSLANDTIVSSGGKMSISDGNANNTTIYTGASAGVSKNGVVNNTIMSGGSITIADGGVANNTTGFGYMTIAKDGVANNITMSGNSMYIRGIANSTTLNGGITSICSGGVANNITVNRGYVYILEGGTATEIIENGGFVDVAQHTNVTFASNTVSGTTIESVRSMSVHKNTIAEDTLLGYFGNMFIYDGGIANGTVVSHGSANLKISSGGVANSTTVNYGNMNIYNGGVANSTTVSGGYMLISEGGIANSTTVNSSGYMYISSGGTATQIIENGGYVGVAEGANVTFVSNTIEGLVLYGRSMTIHSNTVANSTTVSYGGMYISSGGVANSTTLNFSGRMHIYSGGVANSTTVNSGGSMLISNGGVANSTTVNGCGNMQIFEGGLANSTTMSGGDMQIFEGGLANSTTMNGGIMHISNGGVANSTTVNSGNMGISNGGVANSTTVNSGGSMYISNGGVASNTTLHSGGSMYFSGGTAYNTELTSGASATFVGGVAEKTIVNANAFLTTSETTVSDLTVKERGAAYISGGTVVGGTVENLGILQLCSGTVASDITVSSGGHCYIGSGAEISGTFTIESGATVLAFTGSTLNFSVDTLVADSDALVNDLSLIRGNIDYTITVAEDQASGVYRLADNVSTFTNDVQLIWGDESFDGLNAGESIESNGRLFELSVEDGSLLLEISSIESPAAEALFYEDDLLQGIEAFNTPPELLSADAVYGKADNDQMLKNGLLA